MLGKCSNNELHPLPQIVIFHWKILTSSIHGLKRDIPDVCSMKWLNWALDRSSATLIIFVMRHLEFIPIILVLKAHSSSLHNPLYTMTSNSPSSSVPSGSHYPTLHLGVNCVRFAYSWDLCFCSWLISLTCPPGLSMLSLRDSFLGLRLDRIPLCTHTTSTDPPIHPSIQRTNIHTEKDFSKEDIQWPRGSLENAGHNWLLGKCK